MGAAGAESKEDLCVDIKLCVHTQSCLTPKAVLLIFFLVMIHSE